MKSHSQAGAHLNDDQIIGLLHSAASPDEASHLAGCPRCRTELEAYKATLRCLEEWRVPERSAEYGQRVWQQIAGRVVKKQRFTWISFPAAAWAAVAVCGAIILLALVLHQPPRETTLLTDSQRPAASNGQELLRAALDDHLERTSVLLTRILNEHGPQANYASVLFDDDEPIDDLIAENRLYRQTAEQQNDRETAALLGDIEAVLLDLQHSGSAATAAELRYAQQRISDSNLRFRLGVVKSSPTSGTNIKLVGSGL